MSANHDPGQAPAPRPGRLSPRSRDRLIEKAAAPGLNLWASLLLRQRQAQEMTPDAQAARLGLDLDALCRLALCRLPRPDRRAEDVEVVARHVGLTVADLERLLHEDEHPAAAAAGTEADAPRHPQGRTRLRLRRVEPGLYRSADGRVEIRKEVSRQTRRADEVCWTVTVDGRTLPRAEETKSDAVRVAEARLTAGGAQ